MNLQEATIKALRGKLLMEDISEINTNEIFNNVKEIIKSNFNIEDGEISKETENEIFLECIDSRDRSILTKKVKKYLLSLGIEDVTDKEPNTRMSCNGYHMSTLNDGYSRIRFYYKDKLIITLTSYNDGNYEVEKK